MSEYKLTGNNYMEIDVLDKMIKNIAKGDKEALADLYRMTNKTVYGFILTTVKNVHEAEDILHDCYVNIFSSAKNYYSNGRPMAWILAIARNLCLLSMREQRKTVNLPEENWEGSIEGKKDISVEDKLLLEACMNELSEIDRQIVWLHAVSGFKHREIANILDVSLPNVLSRYHRALKKLKTSIEKGKI